MLMIIILLLLIIFSCNKKESDDFQFDVSSRPSYSRDGNSILFSPRVKGKYRIFMLNLKNRSLKWINTQLPLTDSCKDAILSFNGKKIAFIHIDNKSNIHEIYIMDPDGTNLKQLTKAGHYSFEPFFSPDGKRIYFLRALKQKKRSGAWLYCIDIDGKNEKKISDENYNIINPNCTMDGKYIIFSEYYMGDYPGLDQRIIKLKIDTGNSTIILDNKRGLVPIPANDGKRIFYLGTNLSNYEADKMSDEKKYSEIFGGIYSMNLDGRNNKILIKETWDTYYITISPDDKKVLYFFITNLMEYNLETNEIKEIIIDKEKIISLVP